MAKVKTPKWVYGRDPNPTSWHEAADVLRQQQGRLKPVRKSSGNTGLFDRLVAVESMLKEKK